MTRARKRQRPTPAPWLPDLVARWRAHAELLHAHGCAEAAATKAHDADELETWLAGYNDSPLTLAEAARESGFSIAHLRRLVSLRVLPNVGQNGEVRVARGSLPRKARRQRLGPDLPAELLGLPGAQR